MRLHSLASGGDDAAPADQLPPVEEIFAARSKLARTPVHKQSKPAAEAAGAAAAAAAAA